MISSVVQRVRSSRIELQIHVTRSSRETWWKELIREKVERIFEFEKLRDFRARVRIFLPSAYVRLRASEPYKARLQHRVYYGGHTPGEARRRSRKNTRVLLVKGEPEASRARHTALSLLSLSLSLSLCGSLLLWMNAVRVGVRSCDCASTSRRFSVCVCLRALSRVHVQPVRTRTRQRGTHDVKDDDDDDAQCSTAFRRHWHVVPAFCTRSTHSHWRSLQHFPTFCLDETARRKHRLSSGRNTASRISLKD